MHKNISILKIWFLKGVFKIQRIKKIIKLFSFNDFKIMFGINQKIKFLTNEKIINKLNKNKLLILVFVYCENINFFKSFKNQIIYTGHFQWKKEIKKLDVKKKYLILGFWRSQMEYYRYLKMHNFKIYLQKEKINHEV